MKNKLSLLMVAALVGNVQAVDSGQNAPLNQFENQLVTAWWNNPDLARDIRRIKEFHKVKDQGKIANLPLRTVTSFVDPTLGKIKPGMLQQSLKQINFAFEEHDGTILEGPYTLRPTTNCQLPVAFMKKGDTVVAAYINDTRKTVHRFVRHDPPNRQVSTLINNLHKQHGTHLPILVNTPHRNPCFFNVTGTLYSSAKEIDVRDSHDLTMHGGTGGKVTVRCHTGDLKTNADHVTIRDPINVNLTCDNKKAEIDINTLVPKLWPEGYPDSVTVTLNDHQGRVTVASDITTVKMKNYSGTEIIMWPRAKAIVENAKIDSLEVYNGDVLIVNGKIRDLRFGKCGGTAWLVDSTVNELNTTWPWLVNSNSDIYLINTEGDLSTAPGMLEKMLKDKDGRNEDKQKTMNSFNALWN